MFRVVHKRSCVFFRLKGRYPAGFQAAGTIKGLKIVKTLKIIKIVNIIKIINIVKITHCDPRLLV